MKMTRWGKRVLAIAASAVLALGCVMIPLPAPQAEPEEQMAYMDTSLSFEERAADLVSRLTLEEKIAHLGNRVSISVPRLGIERYDFWTEGLHGVARMGKATSFPYSIAMAATWDPALIEQITTAVSDEARAYDNRRADGFGRLVYWSPTINMARDPRWGRNHESYGEDPFLTTQIGAAFVSGLQGDDDHYYKVISTIKHYAANNSEYNRHTGDSQMDDRTLREYYTRAFKGIVRQANVGGVMSSYNRVNGEPASASVYLLDTLLRRTFGFDGYVTSDCGAIQDITEQHKWIPEGYDRVVTKEESVYYGLLAGCDIDCGSIYPNYAKSALDSGVLSEDMIDLALLHSFTARMRTGEFDPAEMVAYRGEEYSYDNQVESAAHKQLAEDSADDAIVLLKNDGVLPLDRNTQKNIVMIGEVANKVDLSNYSGSPSAENMSTPVQGMTALGANVTYIKGGTSGNSSSQYLCNLKNITINKSSGDPVVLTPAQAQQLNACRYESGNGNIGYIESGATLMFKDVDIKDAVSVSFQLAGDNSVPPATVTMTMDSVDGMQVTQVASDKTGGWQTYRTVTGEVGDLGGYETKDLYLSFKLELQDVTFSAADTTAIRNADAVIVCLEGNGSGEGTDRSTITMPSYQLSLAKTAATLNDNVIVYMQTVGVMEIEQFMDDVQAILWTSFNGQAQGNAMARVIYGEVNPSAKLPQTWYARNADLETINDYNIRGEEDFAGWSYQYYKGDVTYPFGYGLSYSDFAYSNLRVDKTTVTPDDTLTATVDVKNTSAVDGKEVVQLYVSVPNNDGVDRPFKQLKAFDKVAIPAGQTKTVTLKLDLSDCYFWDEDLQKNVYDQGEYTLFVGTSSEEGLTTTFTMDGELTKKLAVVTATAPGIKLNAANASKTFTADVTAALNDDSFLDLNEATVAFSSADTSVVTVDDHGVVRPVGSGVTSVTASVTYNGETVSDSFPVVVVVNLEGIEIDGEPLKGFAPDTTEYTVPVDSDHPVVTVPGVAPENVQITNASSVPGDARVVITVAGTESEYTLHFVKRSHDYVVARFSDFEGTYETSNKKTLSTNWKSIDGGAAVDFTAHDLSDLHLRMVLNMEQTGATKVDDGAAYHSGFLKIRSVDAPGENNAGWLVNGWHLKDGANYVDLPLSKMPDSRTGILDWSKVNRIIMYIDSLNNYEGPFVATISDAVVVDTSLDPAREALWQYVDDGTDESMYTQASLIPYQQAKEDIRSLIFSADAVPQETVDAAIAAYETAKAGLREDVYLIGTFPASNRTSTVIKSGDNYTGDILYNDWTTGDGVPFDLSGDRSNLRLQMTVKFISETDAIAAKDLWRTLTIKLRSSDEAGRDGNPNNSEHNYGWDIHPADVTDPETVQVSIDLSSDSTNHRGLIDWADIRRLIILGDTSQEARNVGARDKYKMQVTGAQIVDLTNVKAEQAEMKALLDQTVNTADADPDAVAAYNDAVAAAEAVVDSEFVTPAELYQAHVALQDAVAALGGDEPQPQPDVTKGDVDGDKAVTAADALLALQIATDKVAPTDEQQAAADVNANGSVGADDALQILQFATDKITAFASAQ